MASGNPSSEPSAPLPPNGAGPETSLSDVDAPGSSAEVALQFAGLDFSGHAVEAAAAEPAFAPSPKSEPSAPRGGEPTPALSWPTVILGSYASAVTLALIWVLATGKTLPKFQSRAPARELEALSPISSPVAAPALSDRSVALGKTLIVGDLEIMPLTVLHKTVRVSRAIGLDGPTWENPDCLVLTLRLKNTSTDRAVTPLAPPRADVEDPAEASYIELGTSRRLSMLDLDLEGEWVIADQSFPTIAPAAAADIVLVSEPVPLERLVGPLTWWIALKTGEDETETVGVRFSRKDVAEVVDGGWSP